MDEYLDGIAIDGLDETYAENVDVEEVESAAVMVVDFLIDSSGSMYDYENVMRDCLSHYKDAISNSKQADEMLVSKTLFDSTITVGGRVFPDDFDPSYSAGGATKLYDAIVDERQRLLSYMEQLEDNGNSPRACVVILSDGEDNGSNCNPNDAFNAIKDLKKKEITVAFVAFGQEAFDIADKLGIDSKNVKKVSNDESELRRIIDLVSKSAISASKKASAGAGTDDGGFFDV